MHLFTGMIDIMQVASPVIVNKIYAIYKIEGQFCAIVQSNQMMERHSISLNEISNKNVVKAYLQSVEGLVPSFQIKAYWDVSLCMLKVKE